VSELAFDEASYEAVHALLKYCYQPHTFSECAPELLAEIERLNADVLGALGGGTCACRLGR
jgi:hypothetical protein